jgi:hypothetical protein
LGLIFGVIALSLGRAIYNAWMIRREYTYKDRYDKTHARQAEVMRRDEYYASD